MRVLYLSSSYLPARRASSVHVMKMCAAIARQGHQVTLVCKRPPSPDRSPISDHDYYGVSPDFDIVKLARPPWRGGGLIYAAGLAVTLARWRRDFDLVYCRDVMGAYLATRSGRPTCFEVHGPPPPGLAGRIYRSVLRSARLKRLVVISRALATHLEENGLVPAGTDVCLAHDAADPLAVTRPATPLEGRRPHVGYVGSLYPGRGVELIFDLASKLHECDFHLVGGSVEDLERLQEQPHPENVIFHGFVAPAKLHAHYGQFDILIMPYQRSVLAVTGRSDISRWFSPLKMFEYMAAGRPIVSSDLPVLREILQDGHNCLLVEPDEVAGWEAAVRRLIEQPTLRRELSENSLAQFQARHTWDARAEAVLAGM